MMLFRLKSCYCQAGREDVGVWTEAEFNQSGPGRRGNRMRFHGRRQLGVGFGKWVLLGIWREESGSGWQGWNQQTLREGQKEPVIGNVTGTVGYLLLRAKSYPLPNSYVEVLAPQRLRMWPYWRQGLGELIRFNETFRAGSKPGPGSAFCSVSADCHRSSSTSSPVWISAGHTTLLRSAKDGRPWDRLTTEPHYDSNHRES